MGSTWTLWASIFMVLASRPRPQALVVPFGGTEVHETVDVWS